MALGVIGLTEDELGRMTPRTLSNVIQGYNKRQGGMMQFERQMAWWQLKAQGAKLKPSDLWPLDVDTKYSEPQVLTNDEVEATMRLYKKINPKLFRPNGIN